MAKYSYPSVGFSTHIFVIHKCERLDADARRLDGRRTIGFSQMLVLRRIMYNIQVRTGSEVMHKVSDHVSLIGGSGMGGYALTFFTFIPQISANPFNIEIIDLFQSFWVD